MLKLIIVMYLILLHLNSINTNAKKNYINSNYFKTSLL